jgi:hypothetical protein
LTEIRIDKLKLGKVSETANGFLKGRAAATRTGVFEYYNLDGTKRFELRHPDEVLKPESLESLKSLPITNDHPKELVNSDNATELSVGMTGETVSIKDDHVMVSLNITDKHAITAIKRGKQELSCGYTVNVIPEIGEYNGQKYTHIQKDINYNHLAIVAKGRAGDDVRLNLDGAFMQCEEIKEIKEDMTTKTDNNVEAEIEKLAETVAQEVTGIDIPKAVEGLEEVEKAVEGEVTESEVIANNDSLYSTIEKLKAENEELKKVNIDSLVIEKTKQRAILLNKASTVIHIDSIIDKTEREIMEAVIAFRLATNKDFSDKSDDYMAGRFDSIIEDSQFSPIKRQMTNIDVKVTAPKITNCYDAMRKQQSGA